MCKWLLYLQMVPAVLLTACSPQAEEPAFAAFVDDVVLKTTPVKNQGASSLCWMYAMLSTIETDRLMAGDSVHLSVVYPVHRYLEDEAVDCFLYGDGYRPSLRGTGSLALHLLDRYGAAAYDACPDRMPLNANALAKGIGEMARYASSADEMRSRTAGFLDSRMGALPHAVYMYGAQYTFREFARSVYAHRYKAFTSFTHHPFGDEFVLEVPDNRLRHKFMNIPLDSMMRHMERAVSHGHAVCWEGDVSEPGFSFERGTAVIPHGRPADQYNRQRDFERHRTTDDHCMSLVGMAHDGRGNRYFIAKNSWGTDNPYRGFMYLSYDYIRMKTIAIYLSDEAYNI